MVVRRKGRYRTATEHQLDTVDPVCLEERGTRNEVMKGLMPHPRFMGLGGGGATPPNQPPINRLECLISLDLPLRLLGHSVIIQLGFR